MSILMTRRHASRPGCWPARNLPVSVNTPLPTQLHPQKQIKEHLLRQLRHWLVLPRVFPLHTVQQFRVSSGSAVMFPVWFLWLFVKLRMSRCPDRFTVDDLGLTARHLGDVSAPSVSSRFLFLHRVVMFWLSRGRRHQLFQTSGVCRRNTTKDVLAKHRCRVVGKKMLVDGHLVSVLSHIGFAITCDARRASHVRQFLSPRPVRDGGDSRTRSCRIVHAQQR